MPRPALSGLLESDYAKSRRVYLYRPAREFEVFIQINLDIVIAVKLLSPRNALICLVSVALLALYLAVWLTFARSSVAKQSDFIIYYSAGTVPLSKLYNVEAQREIQTGVLGSTFPVKGGVMPFNHTPVFVPLLHLLVDDDYAASYLRWTSLLWVAVFVCAFMIFRMTGDVAFALAAASFYPLFTYVQQAHDTVFLLLGILLGAHLLSLRKDFLAGIALSLTTLKPQFAIFLAVPLVIRPKAFFGFCAASALLAIYSVLLVGSQGVADFLTLLRINAQGEVFGVRPLEMFNLLGLMERAGVSSHFARPIAWAIFVLASISLFFIWKRQPSNPPFALTILLAVFTSPHLLGHDLALLLVCFTTVAKPTALFLLGSSLAFVTLSIFFASKWQFAFAYLLMGALLAMAIRDIRQPGRAAS